MILILGGGLAGLSAAWHLGDRPHLVLEAEHEPGGLCRSREIDGFVFDYTGHLLHLREPRIVRLVEELLPGGLATLERRAFIRTRGATLPFPFQAHLHGLPADVVCDCVVGFAEASGRPFRRRRIRRSSAGACPSSARASAARSCSRTTRSCSDARRRR